MTLGVGVHDGIPAAEYHDDPVSELSLTSSGIKTLLSGSPAEYAAKNPRLSRWPEALKKSTTAQDMGTVVHSIVLGVGSVFCACDPQDCPARTKTGEPYKTWSGDAAKWKEEQEALGTVIVSRKEGQKVLAAADSLTRLIARDYGDDWLSLGKSEQTLVWQRETSLGPIWCRARLDFLSLQLMTILDPKSTGLGIGDAALQRMAAKDGWHIQQAWYLEGVDALGDKNFHVDAVRFRFPVVESTPPYQARWVDLPESWIGIARQRIDRAAETFARCLRANEWPEHPPTCEPQMPDWMAREFEEEEMRDE